MYRDTSCSPLVGHKAAVRALAYAPGAQSLLASAGDDRVVRLWNLALGEEVALLEGREGLLSLDFTPDGKRLATGGRAGVITVWDIEKQQRESGGEQASGPVVSLSFTGGGRALLGALSSRHYGDNSWRLWCWNLSPTFPLQPLDWRGDVESVAISPARDVWAIARQSRSVEFWEVGRPQNEPAFWMPGRVKALAFSPGDGRMLAVAGGKSIGLWQMDTRQWRTQWQGHRGDVLALAFSPDGLLLLTGGMDRSVRLWETLSGRQLAAWDWKVGIVHALAYSPDGMTAAVAGEKPRVIVWDVDEG